MLRASALNAAGILNLLVEGLEFRRLKLKPQSSNASPGFSSAEQPVGVSRGIQKVLRRKTEHASTMLPVQSHGLKHGVESRAGFMSNRRPEFPCKLSSEKNVQTRSGGKADS